MNNPAGLSLPPRAWDLRNNIREAGGGDCEVGKVTLNVLRIIKRLVGGQIGRKGRGCTLPLVVVVVGCCC